MREDPVISAGLLKLIGVLLAAAVLGGGAYAIASGGLDLDLPDLDTGEETTALEETDLRDTTIDGGQEPALEPQPQDPFTSAGFAEGLAKVRGEVGPRVELTRLFINDVQTQFIVRRGDGVEAYSVRVDSSELVREEATVTISGNATLADFAYRLNGVEPGAIDRMLSAARKLSRARDFQPTVLSLERDFSFGSGQLEWTINGEGRGRSFTMRARADGRQVRDLSGGGSAVPEAALKARELNDCITGASGNPEAIFDCLEKFQ